MTLDEKQQIDRFMRAADVAIYRLDDVADEGGHLDEVHGALRGLHCALRLMIDSEERDGHA